MKRLFILLLTLSFLDCSNHPEQFIPFLEGFWEIKEVTLTDGSKKEYTYNDTVEYFHVTDSLTGFRKKLKPTLTGSFHSSDGVESILLKVENDSLNMYYSTPFSKWKETVLSASENELLVINEAKVRYLYKRYQPLDLSNEQTP